MEKTRFDRLMEDPEFRRLYAVEGLVTEAAEFVARLMERQGVSKAELARRLGKSRAYVTQLLRGSTNLTVRTLAEVAYALGAEVKLEAVPFGGGQRAGAPVEPVWKVIELGQSGTRRSGRVGPAGARRPVEGPPVAYVA